MTSSQLELTLQLELRNPSQPFATLRFAYPSQLEVITPTNRADFLAGGLTVIHAGFNAGYEESKRLKL